MCVRMAVRVLASLALLAILSGAGAIGPRAWTIHAAEPVSLAVPEPIRVLARGHENRFPNSLRFTLSAESDAPITRATVYYRVGDEAITSFAPARVKPGRRIEAEHVVDLRRFYEPPGVEIRYRWRLEDEVGRAHSTDWQSFVLDDPRFQWQTTRVENVELKWYRGGDAFGEALREPARRVLERLRADAGVEIGRTLKVYVYGSEADFRSASGPGTHEWAGGSAFTRDGVVLILAPPNALEYARRTVAHELTHVVVYQSTRNPYGGLPTWLEEGLAMRSEGDLQPSFRRALDAAIKEDRLISVWALSSSFPTDADQAELSYAQSYSLVEFVVERYGQAGMSRLLAEFREGATFDDALRAALGVDTYGLDDQWRASLGLRPLAPVAAATAVPVEGAPLAAEVPTPAPGPALASATPTATVTPPTAPAGESAGRCAAPVALAAVGAVALAAHGRRRR